MRLILFLLLSVFLVACSNNDVEKTTDNLTNVEATNKNDFPTSKEVYDYAQSEFDSLTNFGENYIPEKHDVIVIQRTANHFDLDYKTTNQLYMEEATGVKDETKFKSNSNTESPSEMTMELYKLLQPNMTYEVVTASTNLEGTLDPLMSSPSDGIESYKYDAVDSASVTLIFNNDRLSVTSQAGLIDTPIVSLDEYNQLVEGMSLTEVISLIGEGEYIGFMTSPNSELITAYTYLVNNSYMQLNFLGDSLYEVPSPY